MTVSSEQFSENTKTLLVVTVVAIISAPSICRTQVLLPQSQAPDNPLQFWSLYTRHLFAQRHTIVVEQLLHGKGEAHFLEADKSSNLWCSRKEPANDHAWRACSCIWTRQRNNNWETLQDFIETKPRCFDQLKYVEISLWMPRALRDLLFPIMCCRNQERAWMLSACADNLLDVLEADLDALLIAPSTSPIFSGARLRCELLYFLVPRRVELFSKCRASSLLLRRT